jgi:hypothetical protein
MAAVGVSLCAAVFSLILYLLRTVDQRLSVLVPIPLGCTPETVHLLLDHDDAEIYLYLAKNAHRTKKTVTRDAVAFTYRGSPIYSKKSRTFEFDGRVCRPKALKVKTNF